MYGRLALRAAFALLLAAAAASAWMDGRYLIALNASDSLPGKLFLVRIEHGAVPARGLLATFSFDGSAWGFPADVPWTKRVAGVPGDAIEVRAGTVFVAGRPAAQLHAGLMESRGLRPILPGAVPPGYLFVAGESARSFDSRYREFGLVPAEDVIGEATVVL